MICAHCGCENPNGIAYCRDCGMSLRAPAPRIAAPTPTPEVAAAAGYFGPPPTPQPMAPPQPMPQPAMPAPKPAAASFLAQTQVATLRSEQAPVDQSGAHAAATSLPCVRCGEKSPEGSRFCHSCGAPISTPRAEPAQPAPPQPQPMQAAQPQPIQAVQAQPVVAAAAPVPQAASPVASVCGRCRGVADPGADFCKFCGARLGEQPTSSRNGAASASRMEAAPSFAGAPAVAAPAIEPGAEAPTGLTRPLHGIGDVSVRARLVRIAKDGSEGAQHAVTADVTDIGRSEGQILLADDPYLSARHARITTRPATDPTGAPSLVLVDLGSVNGVYVRLRGPHALTHGDLLLLGQQVLRFEAVTEIEGARGPAMQHGVLLFGSPAPASRARLVQRTVEGLVRDVFYLVRDEFVMGRENGDRTFPEDVFMSRKHAAVRRDASGFVLQDLGSSNGTFVQIHGEHVLRDGDQFRIGHHLFRVDLPTPGSA
ncbi:MAG: FHA domain-containing protein [Polyangiales bacterium]